MPDLLWQPGAIGRLSVPHRVVMGAMHLGLEDHDDGGRALAAFYAERVRGGAGLIITGGWAVSRVGAAGPHYGLLDEPRHREALDRVVEEVHAAGGLVALQLFHAGRYASRSSFGLDPVAPSAVPSRFSPDPPRVLTPAEVSATAEEFARGAAVAAAAGFDAVELMGSEGYLLNQFVSPLTNHREDEYGGDAERRMRLPLDVVRSVRAAAGASFPVIYRMSGADLVPGSTTPEETQRFARALRDAGVDALNVGIGWHESRVPTVQLTVPPVAWATEAAVVKEAVGDLPVIAGNRVNRLTQAEELLRSGAADFVSMARAFLADPEVVEKGRSAPSRPVNLCIACDQACIDRSVVDEPVSCMVNPRAAREVELGGVGVPGTAGAGRRFAVVGGGPAGLSAARALALTGAGVELFEQAAELGGQFRLARLVPGKADYAETVRYYESELGRLGVNVHLGRPADAHRLASGGLSGVVVATGVRPRVPDLPGVRLGHVLTYPEAFAALAPDRPHSALVGARVAVVGAGGVAVDLALLLTHRPAKDELARFRAEHLPMATGDAAPEDVPARQVTLMRRAGRVGAGIGRSTRWVLLGELQRRGVVWRTGIRYEAIVPEGVRLTGPDGPELLAVDTVVLAAGQVPHDPLSAALASRGVPHVVVGGAREAIGLDAVRAFEEGLLAASELVGIDRPRLGPAGSLDAVMRASPSRIYKPAGADLRHAEAMNTPEAASESPSTTEPVDTLARALDQLAALIDRVDPSLVTAPTPCASWDTAALLDHVVADLPPFIAGAKGEQADWSAQQPSVAPDWAPAFRRGADELLRVWRAPRAGGGGDAGAAAMPVDMATTEFAVHGWDLAVALGDVSSLDPAPAERGLAMMQGMLQPSMRGSEADGKVFGPEVTLQGDATAYERLVACAGRDPHWQA